MSAVERVEILTDGASALYGSDAIAGVINFILKRNQQGGDIEANYSTPTESRAGDSKYVSGSYGFGDLETNGYNVLAAFRHDQQSQIKSTGREFAKTAYIPFDFRGNHQSLYLRPHQHRDDSRERYRDLQQQYSFDRLLPVSEEERQLPRHEFRQPEQYGGDPELRL
jgi:outer membrane receptor protein involved in Fe transport